MTRALTIGLLASLLVLVRPATAEAPPADRARAASLHAEAIKLFTSKKLDAACRLWSQAERADPSWKYAFNLAGGLLELGEPLDAWAALERARDYGVPPESSPRVSELRGRVAARLSQTLGQLHVSPTPADAVVTIDGAPIRPHAWLPPGPVSVVVQRAGFRAETVAATVVRGEERVVTVALAAVARSPGTVLRQPADLDAAASRRDTLELTFDDGPSAQVIAGYSTLGVGVAVVAVGLGLIGWSESLASDAEAENQAPSSADFATYSSRYADDKDHYERVRTAGWASFGVGLAATLTGLTLVLVDDGGASTSVVVQPDGIRTSWRF